MIDVIIPCYNAQGTLNRTLESISSQTIVEKVQVLLVDDCSSRNYDSFIDRYSPFFSIRVLRLNENGGAGVAREHGIMSTCNPFIVFIDSDDYFYDNRSLEVLFRKISEGYDYVNAGEYDEKKDQYIISNGNVHGKIYRREFLMKNDIHFNHTRYHEDNYFNNLVFLSGSKYCEVRICTYYYTFNKASLTNVISYDYDRLEIYLSNMYDLTNIILKKEYPRKRFARFKLEKYHYLYRVYHTSDSTQQEIFLKLIKRYDPNFLDFVFFPKPIFREKLKNYLIGILNS